MTTQTPNLTAPSGVTETTDAIGIVGHRPLIAVQTWEIARLTPHPVPLVPARFIAVSGTGPEGDSNGSGKTSFLAAISLLLCDAQWRLESSGYQSVPALLFDPESAGLARGLGYRQSDHGYIIGVFADATGTADGAVTVCLRISATTPYLKVRWAPGVHLVEVSDDDLEVPFDHLWASFPQTAKDELGPMQMKAALYGKAAKGIAYIDTSMRKSAPSLLSQELTQMTPEQIGMALIELTGRQGLLEREKAQRSRLAEQQAKLAIRQEEDQQSRIDEDQQLDAVRHRDHARASLAEGERLWQLHFARGYLEKLEDDNDLEGVINELGEEVFEAEEVAARAREHHEAIKDPRDLRAKVEAAQKKAAGAAEALRAADRAHERHLETLQDLDLKRQRLQQIVRRGEVVPVSTASEQKLKAEQAFNEADEALRKARARADRAASALAEVRDGSGGDARGALALLRDAGIDGRLLIDEVRLADDARPVWEPILSNHRTAVVVSHEQHAEALAALRSLPGTVLVPTDTSPRPFPPGVGADLPLGGILERLGQRYRHETSPLRAVDVDLDLHLIGGFLDPIAGRAARISQAERHLQECQRAVEAADKKHRTALSELDLAVQAHERAEAAEALVAVEEERSRAAAESEPRATALAEAAEADEVAQGALVDAMTTLKSHSTNVELALARRQNADNALAAKRTSLRAKESERENLRLDFWAAGWGDSPDAAHRALEQVERPATRATRKWLRNRSGEHLKDALDAYAEALRGSPVPPELGRAIERRQQLVDSDRPGFGRDEVSFDSVARPLRDLLDAISEMDQQLRERIERHQLERAARIEAVASEVEKKQSEWSRFQDMIAGRIEASLKQISDKVDHLVRSSGGWGAELSIIETRPSTVTGTWRWEVAPRWKRSSSGSLVDYHHNANGAQIKVFAIKLVLAALLADDGAGGRVLVIDELGNSLGDVNRRVVLRDISQVAQDQGVTILGTCQDSVIDDAGKECGQVLWFQHASSADATNQPTKMWDYDDNRNRVELTIDYLTAGRTLV